jgi:Nitrate and nitrite sensing
LRRVPIRMKLAGALAVPLVALVAVTALEVVQSVRDAELVRDQTELAEASIGPASVLSKVEDERNAAAVYLLGMENDFALPVEDNAAARAATDESIEVFRRDIERLGGAVEDAYGPALDDMAALDDLRAQIDGAPDGSRGLGNIEAVSSNFDGYTAAMQPLFEANKQVALAIDDPDLRRGAELIDLGSRQTDIIATLVRDLLLAAVGGTSPDGVNAPAEVSAVAAGLTELRANEQRLAAKGTGLYRELVEDLFADEAVANFPPVVEQALTTGAVDLDGVIRYSAGDDPSGFGYTVFRGGVTEALGAEAEDLLSAAEARQRWFIVLAVVAVSLATTVTWLVSRSITKPLRSLTRQAT